MGGLRKLRRKGAGRYTVEPLHATGKPQGTEKLSAVILDFARPLTDTVEDELLRNAIMLAIFCWNIALLPEDEQERELRLLVRETARDMPAGFVDDMMTWARWLIDRKKKLFAHDRRMVVDHTIQDEGNDFHLYVASTVVPAAPSTPPEL